MFHMYTIILDADQNIVNKENPMIWS